MKEIKCKICGKLKPHLAKGMCNTCYKREGTPKVKCKRCGKVRPHHAFDLCSPCYSYTHHLDSIKKWNYENWHKIPLELYKEITKECSLCGFKEFVEMHHLDKNKKNSSRENLIGLCPNHHRMIHDIRFKKNLIKELKIRPEKSVS